jgi:Response regulators consisting of a CheY-like receiver domain and a winged-helix DNA-binding domain
MRLLIVEDSPTLGPDLRVALARDGHAADLAVDGTQALAFVAAYAYDVVVLDLMLPKLDGWSVLRRIREVEGRPGVLVLSACDQVADRVEALNLGADDYLVKPFAYDELLARILAVARRGQVQLPLLRAGSLEVDSRARLARVDGQVLALTPKEYALLEALLGQRGTVRGTRRTVRAVVRRAQRSFRQGDRGAGEHAARQARARRGAGADRNTPRVRLCRCVTGCLVPSTGVCC